MPINRVKDRQGRARFEFEFSRRIGGRRVRVRKLLPPAWTRAQADAFDRQESARLYAQVSGVERQRYTIGQAVARYLDERAASLKHGKGVAQELRLMLPWYSGKPLDELPQVCAAYMAEHRAQLAPATIRNRLRYLTAACRWAWRHHGMSDHDPAARVVMPSVSNERQVYIDRRQMLALARACRSWEVRAMIRIAFYSGMRLSEIIAAEIDGDTWLLRDTKNGDPRIVPMHPRCRVYAGYAWPSRFMTQHHFAQARTAAGMPHVRFHDLRHSAASAMLNAGVPLYTVGAVLGHKSAASTKRYSHLATESLMAAIGRIGKAA